MLRQTALILAGAFVGVALMASQTLSARDTSAFLGGYVLFAIDIVIIAWVARALVAASTGGTNALSGGGRAGALLVAGLKLILLAAGLYYLLVVQRLSGLLVAAGAFLALILVCISAYVNFLKGRSGKALQ